MTKTFDKARPAKPFLLLFTNTDGTVAKHRTTLADLSRFEARYGEAPKAPWRYEHPGEAGIYPTMEEWNRIHPEGRCGSPCACCKAAGLDPMTGKTP